MKMPFGKYKGLQVEEIAPEYLEWLWNNIELKGRLREAVYRVLTEAKRDERPGVPRGTREKFACLKQIYHELCHKYHPDKGGSNSAMAAVNEFYEKLKDTLSP